MAGAEGAVGRFGGVVFILERLLLPEEDEPVEAEAVHVLGEQGAVGSGPGEFVADHIEDVFVFVVVHFHDSFHFNPPDVPMAWPMQT